MSAGPCTRGLSIRAQAANGCGAMRLTNTSKGLGLYAKIGHDHLKSATTLVAYEPRPLFSSTQSSQSFKLKEVRGQISLNLNAEAS